ncbi:DUF3890 domain-containing protein (plasmid) [Borrelia miyamotoi]|uniref:DUF3890 domain-containing protein n=1 Tax=Borrelia miyamotoi TaxID=47466 RepID=A0A482CYT0_9SPIR|nr:DUF3890 domain-containing protein [Borrelia miyamotoi]ATQ19148.2 DUF3890 domain-containing protein [Borrelia miyamotoi]QBK62583.1 DUF3890 domain-containing protein [Borrelia miyamotoi]QBK63880.1 DUF3890 domain-containing protein [Borrelia miyamotoi]QBK65191.1 DUF3890 domain-containing protein [Borrelia miyamotoi]QBK66436.1 DUF3890 domain-containing protein [Borrelia miyamotoi]
MSSGTDGFKDIYTSIKSLLGVSESDLSFDMFKVQANLLEMILETRGINLNTLNANQISLLLTYHIGCQLRRCGVINEFVQIKKEKLGELEIDYYQQENCNGLDYCSSFENLVTQIKSGEHKTYSIGVV